MEHTVPINPSTQLGSTWLSWFAAVPSVVQDMLRFNEGQDPQGYVP